MNKWGWSPFGSVWQTWVRPRLVIHFFFVVVIVFFFFVSFFFASISFPLHFLLVGACSYLFFFLVFFSSRNSSGIFRASFFWGVSVCFLGFEVCSFFCLIFVFGPFCFVGFGFGTWSGRRQRNLSVGRFHSDSYRVLLGFTDCSAGLAVYIFNEFLLRWIGFHLILLGFYWVWPGLTGF